MLSQKYTPQFTPRNLQQPLHFTFDPMCNAVVHPVTGETITEYKKLIVDEVTKPVWEEAMCKELGRLTQGYNTTKGTNTIHFMKQEDIKNIPKDQTVTYARIVVDYCPQKKIQTEYVLLPAEISSHIFLNSPHVQLISQQEKSFGTAPSVQRMQNTFVLT